MLTRLFSNSGNGIAAARGSFLTGSFTIRGGWLISFAPIRFQSDVYRQFVIHDPKQEA